MYDFYKLIGFMFLSMLITGCASGPAAVETCPEVDAAVAEVAPPDSAARKVVFLGFTDAQAGTNNAGVAALIETNTATLIGQSGAEVADSSLAKDLSSEIRRYEAYGKSSYRSNLATDAIKGEIIDGGVSHAFSKASTQTYDGKKVRVPARCNYTGNISGTLKIYSINPLTLVRTIPINGSSNMSVETSNSSCPISAEQQAALIRKAALNSAQVKDYKSELFDHFRQVGHIREVRICDLEEEDNFLWLSVTPSQGATPKSDVNIYRQYWYEDKLEKTRILRKKLVASGQIVTTSNSAEAWVRIKERSQAEKVMLGDLAEIIHDDCQFAPGSIFCAIPGM